MFRVKKIWIMSLSLNIFKECNLWLTIFLMNMVSTNGIGLSHIMRLFQNIYCFCVFSCICLTTSMVFYRYCELILWNWVLAWPPWRAYIVDFANQKLHLLKKCGSHPLKNLYYRPDPKNPSKTIYPIVYVEQGRNRFTNLG